MLLPGAQRRLSVLSCRLNHRHTMYTTKSAKKRHHSAAFFKILPPGGATTRHCLILEFYGFKRHFPVALNADVPDPCRSSGDGHIEQQRGPAAPAPLPVPRRHRLLLHLLPQPHGAGAGAGHVPGRQRAARLPSRRSGRRRRVLIQDYRTEECARIYVRPRLKNAVYSTIESN